MAPAPRAFTHNEYCTLFDINYLPRGLVLYESLRRVCPTFHLRVLCMDEETKDVLDRLCLPALTAIAIGDLEAHDPALAAVRRSRSRVEYCWTATAPLCLFCLEREPGLELITYIDADLMFYEDPWPAFAELAGGSILVTPHRYARHWQWLERDSGKYNVQFVTFRRDQAAGGLSWWRERCLEWCHDRVEDGRFGDQRYLDEWPELFDGVRVLDHPGAGLGPWSSGRFPLALDNGRVLVDGRSLLFYHFHGLRISGAGLFRRLFDRVAGGRPLGTRDRGVRWSSDYPLSRLERQAIWGEYAERVLEQTDRVVSIAPHLQHVFELRRADAILRRLAMRTPHPLPAAGSRVHRWLARGRIPSVAAPAGTLATGRLQQSGSLGVAALHSGIDTAAGHSAAAHVFAAVSADERRERTVNVAGSALATASRSASGSIGTPQARRAS